MTPTPPPSLTYDSLGNCYVNAIGLRGRCVSYPQCYSAVLNWQYYQKIPFSCYYTTYENFVCCPEAYVAPSTHATASPMYYPHTNPFLSSNYGDFQIEKRISEKGM